jgi:hypothetical protein
MVFKKGQRPPPRRRVAGKGDKLASRIYVQKGGNLKIVGPSRGKGAAAGVFNTLLGFREQLQAAANIAGQGHRFTIKRRPAEYFTTPRQYKSARGRKTAMTRLKQKMFELGYGGGGARTFTLGQQKYGVAPLGEAEIQRLLGTSTYGVLKPAIVRPSPAQIVLPGTPEPTSIVLPPQPVAMEIPILKQKSIGGGGGGKRIKGIPLFGSKEI